MDLRHKVVFICDMKPYTNYRFTYQIYGWVGPFTDFEGKKFNFVENQREWYGRDIEI